MKLFEVSVNDHGVPSCALPTAELQVGDVLEVRRAGHSVSFNLIRYKLAAECLQFNKTLQVSQPSANLLLGVCVRTENTTCPRVMHYVKGCKLLNFEARRKYILNTLEVGQTLRITTLAGHPNLHPVESAEVNLRSMQVYAHQTGVKLDRKFLARKEYNDVIITRKA